MIHSSGLATIKEASTKLNLTERWLQVLCKQGRIPGAVRFNGTGPWLIPNAWIKSEQIKRNRESNASKEEAEMKKIAFVYDDVSSQIGKDIISILEKRGIDFCSKGEIPIYAHAEESIIISKLNSLILDADMVIGVSSSGNGISIYANKIAGFTAAPVSSLVDIDEAIDIFRANAF